MKIAVLGTRGFPGVQGGVESHCENLYPLLAERGCKVTVFSRRPYTEVTSFKGVKLIPLSCPKNKFLEAFLHTFLGIFAARRLSPDVLHIQAIGPSLFAPLARILGMNVVITHHGPDYLRSKWGRLAKSVLKFAEFCGIKTADKVIAISKDIAAKLKKIRSEGVIVIPNGIKPMKQIQSTSKLKRLGLKENKYILSVGRFVPEKGFLDLIEAFRRLQVWLPQIKKENWKLVIAGCADHQNDYSRQIEDAAAGNPEIILPGFLSGTSLQEIFTHAGIFVLPSYYEGMPIVLLEALSYGLSCIVTDIPGNRNVDLGIDRLYSAGDILGLTFKLGHFINHPLSSQAKQRQIDNSRRNYDWQDIADNTMAVYQMISQ